MRGIFRKRQFSGLVLIIVLIAGLAAFTLGKLRSVMTEQAVSAHHGHASLTARVLRERFDRLSDLGVALALPVQFRRLAEQSRWTDAIATLEHIPAGFPFVDRIFLTDSAGVLHADLPEVLGVHGQNFSFRDWYQGVSARGAPYVSNVYQRTAQPPLKVIAVAVPVRGTGDPERIVGYLVLQIRIDALLAWSQEIDYGADAYAVFVDRAGTLAAHPKFPPQGDLIDYSVVPWVQEARTQHHGVNAEDNPLIGEERLVAYEQVTGYGWVVGISHGSGTAFAARTQVLRTVGMAFAMALGLAVILALSISRGFRRLQDAKDEFIVTATHQLKTPLVGLRWTLDSLRIPPEALSSQQRAYLANLRRFGDMIASAVDELLDVSRIQLGTLNLEITDTKTHAFFQEVVDDMRPYAALRNRTVTLSIADDVPSSLALDQKMVYHVLQNLISNGLDYSPPATPVIVRCVRNGSDVRVEIENRGSPISSEARRHLFEKFYRAPEAKRIKAVGTGIGLYIAKSFAERWGGRIGFDSGGDTTVFWITIPLQPNLRPGDELSSPIGGALHAS